MRRVGIEWGLLLVALIVLAAWLGQGPAASVSGRLVRPDAALYDLANQIRHARWHPAVVVIEIDEASLARIGRWPWPRAVHAALLDSLTRAGARVIGLDLLLAEDAVDDEIFAQSLHDAVPTVLPVASERDRQGREWPIYPVPSFGQMARIGHVHFGFDRDGVVRGLDLVENGLPAFALALHAQAGGAMDHPLLRAARGALADQRPGTTTSSAGFALLPPFAANGHRVSYAALLAGEVPLADLRDRIVIVGATAAGMRDAYSNSLVRALPISPGVLLHVAALSAFEQGMLARRIGPGWQLALSCSLVLLTMALLYLSRPGQALAATVLLALTTIALSGLLLQLGFWFPPAGTLTAIGLAYPLWSWRRLESLVAELQRQVGQMRKMPAALRASIQGADLVGSLLPPAQDVQRQRFQAPDDPVSEVLSQLRLTGMWAMSLRQLLATTLERLPHPGLVLTRRGAALLRNERARSAFPQLTQEASDARSWLLQEFGDDAPMRALFDENQASPPGLERQDRQGRDWLIDSERVVAEGLPAVWLMQFTDISTLRAMQREREQMMRFVSHDLRSPLVSILAALEQSPGPTDPQVQAAIGRHARRSLELAESFVQWTRAENKVLQHDPLDLADLLTECVDQCWQAAQRAKVSIELQVPGEAAIRGDAGLVKRAVVNLVENAIKYGGPGKRVRVSLLARGRDWRIEVADQGPGLPPGQGSRLFEPYFRGQDADSRTGLGLGLALVRLVAERHGGRANAVNRAGGGAIFGLELPADPSPPEQE
ncbi:MAG: CHASE2 domain-containing protein [Burkholderiaceae bacterium]